MRDFLCGKAPANHVAGIIPDAVTAMETGCEAQACLRTCLRAGSISENQAAVAVQIPVAADCGIAVPGVSR